MLSHLLAIALVLFLRAASIDGRRMQLALPLRLLSGLWLGVAAWVMGALLHAWVPIWQMLLVGLLAEAGVAIAGARVSINLRPAADLFAIGMLGMLSVIPVHVRLIVAAMPAFAAAGYALDWLTGRLFRRHPVAALAAPALCIALIGARIEQTYNFGSRLLAQDSFFPLRLALAMPSPGERLQDLSGHTGWLSKNPATHAAPAAVLLHGAHMDGSRQPAAIALQGALLRAGYQVFSIEHPGFGDAPAPPAQSDVRAWDPTAGPEEVISAVRSKALAQAPFTVLVGHSMGVDVVLQLLQKRAPVSSVYLFAGAGSSSTLSEDDWVKGFHWLRNLPCCMPLQTVRAIREQFYSSELVVGALPADHPPVNFVRFGIEYDDVARDRDLLYAAIPAPKKAYDLPRTTHYLNTLALRPFVLADTRAIIDTAQVFATNGR